MLSLLVCHHKDYDALAALLNTEPQEIRQRAHAALGELAGGMADGELGPDLMDYALGQLDPAHVDRLTAALGRSEILRSWDFSLSVALAQVAPAQPRMAAPTRETRRRPTRPAPGATAVMLSIGFGSVAVGAGLFILGTHPL